MWKQTGYMWELDSCFILISKPITGKDLNVKKTYKKTEENMSKLFISKSRKSLSENSIEQRMKNLTKVKFKKKLKITTGTAILT